MLGVVLKAALKLPFVVDIYASRRIPNTAGMMAKGKATRRRLSGNGAKTRTQR